MLVCSALKNVFFLGGSGEIQCPVSLTPKKHTYLNNGCLVWPLRIALFEMTCKIGAKLSTSLGRCLGCKVRNPGLPSYGWAHSLFALLVRRWQI